MTDTTLDTVPEGDNCWRTGSPWVALAGDWHGNMLWAVSCIRAVANAGMDTILQVGDFGLWPGVLGKRFLNQVESACKEYGVTILVTPGNHEDWDRIESRKPKDRGDGLGPVQWFRDHVAFLPRGHRFTLLAPGLPGRSVVSLGGAPSIDFEHRTEGRSWWPAEQIPAEVAEQVAADGYADIMLAHDSPDAPYWAPKVAHICTSPSGWSLRALSYAAVGRQRLHTAFEGVRPRLFVHGHYHVRSAHVVNVGDHDCQVVALDADGVNGNMAAVNLDLLEAPELSGRKALSAAPSDE